MNKTSILVTRLCRYIENAPETPSLDELAKEAHLSPYHLHRVFKAVTGLTPRDYAAAHRAKRVRSQLTRKQSVTDAIYGAGYNSNGRFYENSNKILGMSPTEYRSGAPHLTIRFAIGESSLGSILVAESDKGICAISLGDNPDLLIKDLQKRFRNATLIGGDAAFEKRVAHVVGFVEAPYTRFDLPLDVRGTAFQQRVWKALCRIPAGETATYTDIAKRIGSPRAVRGVARACASNTLAVAIPCHRVVRQGGALAGYRWGIERKRALLLKELQCPSEKGLYGRKIQKYV
jgi:AraC family transcriptional regulator of adaptative response/methylated-DNA-[protein]-cysteine methyltransferase